MRRGLWHSPHARRRGPGSLEPGSPLPRSWRRSLTRSRVHFLFLNVGHFLDHLFMLVFASAAALTLARDWGMSYAELIPYATPGFVAFAVCSIPAGWIADKWSRQGMMVIFFLGIGVSGIVTARSAA